MVAYNFQRCFAPDILAGLKQSTIRPKGKRKHASAGDELQLFVGMRTKSCRMLMRVRCEWSRPIEIHHHGFRAYSQKVTSGPGADILARVDGFSDWPAMIAWFDHRYSLPLHDMVQIRWDFAAATFLAVEGREGAE